jgi:PIN domain nuclease of toxin-antitoxin system
LLDTHVLLWAIYEPVKLSPKVHSLLSDPSNELIVSYAAVWEILSKVGRGGLLIAGSSSANVLRRIEDLGVTLLPITLNHILAASNLPDLHRDPFDRMFIAQSISEQVPLITIDPKIWGYPLETIWA